MLQKAHLYAGLSAMSLHYGRLTKQDIPNSVWDKVGVTCFQRKVITGPMLFPDYQGPVVQN